MQHVSNISTKLSKQVRPSVWNNHQAAREHVSLGLEEAHVRRFQEDPLVSVSLHHMKTISYSGMPFANNTFILIIELPDKYPNKLPTVRFLSKIFHPHVYADSSICLDILQNGWNPTYSLSS